MEIKNKKGLVIYFSRKGNNFVNGNIVDLPVGNTKIVADMISDITGSELFEVQTINEYPLDYTDSTIVAKEELRNNERPELVEYLENIDEYDVIYLGYPNWWGTMPMPLYTLLEKYDFSNKVVLPFCTHEGSGLSNSEMHIKEICKNAEVKKGLAIHGGSVKESKSILEDWINKM